MSPGDPSFTPLLFSFLRELATHNNRDWFIDNRSRYLADVRDPVLAFIAAVEVALHQLSRHVLADPRPVGGSMFRINRDVRLAGGVYRADRTQLSRIRDAIVADPAAWRLVSVNPRFAPMFEGIGDRVGRIPAGSEPDHPYAQDLRRRYFVRHRTFSEEEAGGPDFIDRFLDSCAVAAPFMGFLAHALGLDW